CSTPRPATSTTTTGRDCLASRWAASMIFTFIRRRRAPHASASSSGAEPRVDDDRLRGLNLDGVALTRARGTVSGGQDVASMKDVVRAAFPVLPYDETAATWHGHERARLEALGRPVPYVDGQIAAIAHASKLVVVTINYEGLLALHRPESRELVE